MMNGSLECRWCEGKGWVDCVDLPGYCRVEGHGGPCRCPAGRQLSAQAAAVAYDNCGHDDMALRIGHAGRYWHCPDCGWSRSAENADRP